MKIDAQIEMLFNEIQLLFRKQDEMKNIPAGFAPSGEIFTGKPILNSLSLDEALKKLTASNCLTQELANKIGELTALQNQRMTLIEEKLEPSS